MKFFLHKLLIMCIGIFCLSVVFETQTNDGSAMGGAEISALVIGILCLFYSITETHHKYHMWLLNRREALKSK